MNLMAACLIGGNGSGGYDFMPEVVVRPQLALAIAPPRNDVMKVRWRSLPNATPATLLDRNSTTSSVMVNNAFRSSLKAKKEEY